LDHFLKMRWKTNNKMKNSFLHIITLFLAVSAVYGFSISLTGTDIKTEFLKKYSEANKNINSIKSNFTQEHHLEIMEEPIVSTGVFYYKKPGLMKWDQLAPTPYYFIVNGDKVIKFDGKKRKELSVNSPQVSYFKNFIMGTVDGSLFESTQFESTFTKSGNQIHVLLNPLEKQLKKRIEKIELTFNESELTLLGLTIFEAGGDKMIIAFSKQKFNTITDNAIFN